MNGKLPYHEVITLLNARDDARPERKLHRLPLERYTLSDCEFFFTICAQGHGQPFLDALLAKRIIEALLWTRQRYQWHLFCYCLMPDHLHFITQLPDLERVTYSAGARGKALEGILEQISRFKSYTTTQCWWKMGGHDELWQGSSYDRVIRYNDSVEEAVSYVLNNPQRKGIVGPEEPYPYAAIVDPWM